MSGFDPNRPKVATFSGATIPCRVCREPADVILKPRTNAEYFYCARCVNVAVERYELNRE